MMYYAYKFIKKFFFIVIIFVVITPKLLLIADDDGIGRTIIYSKKELEKKKFKLADINKIVKAIENDTILVNDMTVSISDIPK